MGRDIAIVGDAVEQVSELVYERVLPTDDVSVRPPVFPERVVCFGYQYIVEALRLARLVVDPEHLELVEAFEVEADAAKLAVDLYDLVILAAGRKARRFERSQSSVGEFHGGNEGIVDVDLGVAGAIRQGPFVDERARRGADAGNVAHQVVRQVDDVRAQVAQCSATGVLLVESPDSRRAVVRQDPLLKVDRTIVVDTAQRAALDQLASLAYGGHETVG